MQPNNLQFRTNTSMKSFLQSRINNDLDPLILLPAMQLASDGQDIILEELLHEWDHWDLFLADL